MKLLKSNFLLVLLIFIIGASLRLHRLNAPLADWHSWRQADTASVTREFIKHNYSILEPHYQDLSNIPSGFENPEGYRMVEFPVINYLIAKLVIMLPTLDFVVTSRIISLIVSSLSAVLLFLIVIKLSGDKLVSFLSGLFFAILPYSVYYGRTILPEPFMVFGSLMSLWTFICWLETKNKKEKTKKRKLLVSYFFFLVSISSLSFSLLLKPTAIFITPVFVVLAFAYLGFKVFKTWELYLFPLSTLPLLWWRHWIQAFPEGIPVNRWLLNGNGIRLKPAWWRWLFADRIGKLISGYWGTLFLSLGLISKNKSDNKLSTFDLFTWTYSASMFSYLVVFATGNVQHDYYQIPLIPVISLLLARGVVFLLNLDRKIVYPVIAKASILFFILLSLSFSYYEVRGYFNINNPAIVKAGQRVDEIIPEDSKVIAPYMGDTAFLFQTNRTGWPIGFDIEKKIEMGAQYYISVNYDDEARELEQKYTVLEKTPDYIIIQLN